MEISDESGAPVLVEDPLEKEIRVVFQDTLGLIHIALVAHYGLEETEATELEKDLHIWFVRFCKRSGNQSAGDSRPFLLVACCQFAREYQRYVVGSGAREADERVKRLLDREPADVARDFTRSLELLNFRQHPDA